MHLAAAKVLIETDLKAEEIARKAIKVASEICVLLIIILQWRKFKMVNSKK